MQQIVQFMLTSLMDKNTFFTFCSDGFCLFAAVFDIEVFDIRLTIVKWLYTVYSKTKHTFPTRIYIHKIQRGESRKPLSLSRKNHPKPMNQFWIYVIQFYIPFGKHLEVSINQHDYSPWITSFGGYDQEKNERESNYGQPFQ